MTNRDEVVELADRIEERRRRGEDYEAEFNVDFGSLTDEEQEDFQALMRQRTAHAVDVLAALEENVRILQLLFAWQMGAMTTLEFVERVRGGTVMPHFLSEPLPWHGLELGCW